VVNAIRTAPLPPFITSVGLRITCTSLTPHRNLGFHFPSSSHRVCSTSHTSQPLGSGIMLNTTLGHGSSSFMASDSVGCSCAMHHPIITAWHSNSAAVHGAIGVMAILPALVNCAALTRALVCSSPSLILSCRVHGSILELSLGPPFLNLTMTRTGASVGTPSVCL
jgi:hypothetical protein